MSLGLSSLCVPIVVNARYIPARLVRSLSRILPPSPSPSRLSFIISHTHHIAHFICFPIFIEHAEAYSFIVATLPLILLLLLLLYYCTYTHTSAHMPLPTFFQP